MRRKSVEERLSALEAKLPGLDEEENDFPVSGPVERDAHGRALVNLMHFTSHGGRDALQAIENELRYLSRRIDANEKEEMEAKEQQETRDNAQDQVIQMELAQLSREITQRVSQDDAHVLKTEMGSRVEVAITGAQKVFEAAVAQVRLELQSEMSDLMSGLKMITQSNSKGNQLLEKRAATMENRLRELATQMDDVATSLRAQIHNVDRAGKSAASAIRATVSDHAVMIDDDLCPRLAVIEARLDENLGDPATTDPNKPTVKDELEAMRGRWNDHDQAQILVQQHLQDLETAEAELRKRTDQRFDQEKSLREHQIASLETNVASLATEARQRMDDLGTELKTQAQHALETATTERDARIERDAELSGMVDELEKRHDEFVATSSSWSDLQTENHDKAMKDLQRMTQWLQALEATVAANRDETNDVAKSIKTSVADKFASVHCELRNTSERLRATTAIAEHTASHLASQEQKLQAQYDDFRGRLLTDAEALNDDTVAARDETTRTVTLVERRVAEQSSDYAEAMARLQRSFVAQTATLRRVDTLCSAVACQGEISCGFDVKIDEEARLLARHCAETEAVAQAHPSGGHRIFSLPYHERNTLAASIQRIAERIALRADVECLRKVLTHDGDPATEDHWDDVVDEFRDSALPKFIQTIQTFVGKLHPTSDGVALDARRRFLLKLELAIKIAMSKHHRIQPNFTLFGKLRLGPTCVACDRPFYASGSLEKSPVVKHDQTQQFYPISSPKKQDFGKAKPPDYVKRGGGFISHQQRGHDDSLTESASMPLLLSPTNRLPPLPTSTE